MAIWIKANISNMARDAAALESCLLFASSAPLLPVLLLLLFHFGKCWKSEKRFFSSTIFNCRTRRNNSALIGAKWGEWTKQRWVGRAEEGERGRGKAGLGKAAAKTFHFFANLCSFSPSLQSLPFSVSFSAPSSANCMRRRRCRQLHGLPRPLPLARCYAFVYAFNKKVFA